MKQRLIYLVGCGRSGTSIIAMTIGQHSDVKSIATSHYWDTYWPYRSDLKAASAIFRGLYGRFPTEYHKLWPQSPYVLDKANSFRGIKEIRKKYPQTKFIFIVRNRNLHIASALKRDDTNYLKVWLEWWLMLFRMKCFTGNKLFVSFEDWAMEPQKETDRICKFCGLEPFSLEVTVDQDRVWQRQARS